MDSKAINNILYLDVGNSSIKGAYKKKTQWEPLNNKRSGTALELIEWIDNHPQSFSEVVISSVRMDVLKAIRQQLKNIPVSELSLQDIPRDLLDYETIDTLGIDRFLSCYGASAQTPNPVVVIDAGTAITVDYMDRDDTYHGGVIAPGFAGFGEVLHKKAPSLPEVDLVIPKKWPGKSTIDSLRWGQAGFYKMAIEGMLDKYKAEFGDYELFITGGNADTIQAMTKREGKVRPFLVFDGMERLYRKP
ncbi:type III pantothenate kinase [Gracilimonas sp.]|uniref:type III pantothenate kinase n=1 Tax=Gracilimonas sp. TaxID=1974203 RepID=UPI00287145DA|nr:type III pantothenate kinase [Gracilimonas sp.]